MTNERMLELVYRFRKLEDEGQEVEAWQLMKNLETMLKADIRAECMKSRGLQKRDKLIQKVLDNIPKRKPLLVGFHPCKGGRFGFCDGVRAYVTGEDYGVSPAPSPMQLDACIPKAEGAPIHVDLAAVQAHIKEQRARRKADKRYETQPVVLGNADFRIGFNAQYLLEFCQFFGTDTIYCSGPKSAATYTDPDTGDWGLLLPVRLK